MNISELPFLKQAAIAIALDNGMIHRNYTTNQFLKKTEDILSKENTLDVLKLETWLSHLEPAVFSIVVAGEQVIAKAICMSCPKDKHDQPVSNILDTIFSRS